MNTLAMRAVTKAYHRVPVVQEATFELRGGEVCGYLGVNGSGKSTTLNMLAGLLMPTHGEVVFNGEPISRNLAAYKRRVGYVPEEPHLYRFLTAQEYLELVAGLRCIAGSIAKQRIAAALATLGLTSERHLRLQGFSKGMKQKILIAAALLHDPDILIFDEPLSGLDTGAILTVRHLMTALAERGKIVVHSSHVLEVVEKICSRVLVLHHGRIVADGSVHQLGALMNLGSLDAIFAQLTEQRDPAREAGELLDVLASGS